MVDEDQHNNNIHEMHGTGISGGASSKPGSVSELHRIAGGRQRERDSLRCR